MDNNHFIGSKRPSPARHAEEELNSDTPPFTPEDPVLPTRNATAVEDLIRQRPHRLTPIPLTALAGKSTLTQQSDCSLTIDDLVGRSPTPNLNDFCSLNFDNISPPGTVTPLEGGLDDEGVIERLIQPTVVPPQVERDVNTEPMWVEERRIALYHARLESQRLRERLQEEGLSTAYGLGLEIWGPEDQRQALQKRFDELREEVRVKKQPEREMRQFERDEEEFEIEEQQERISEHKVEQKWLAEQEEEELQLERDIQSYERLSENRRVHQADMDLSRRKNRQLFINDEKEELRKRQSESHRILAEEKEKVREKADLKAKKARLRSQLGEIERDRLTHAEQQERIDRRERDEIAEQQHRQKQLIGRHKVEVFLDEEEQQRILREEHSMKHLQERQRQLVHQHEQQMNLRQLLQQKLIEEERQNVLDQDPIFEATMDQHLMQEEPRHVGMDGSSKKRRKVGKKKHQHQQEVELDDQHHREMAMEQQLMQEDLVQPNVDTSHKKRQKGSKKKHRQHQEVGLDEQGQHLIYDQRQQEAIMDQHQLMQEESVQTTVDAGHTKRHKGSKKKHRQNQKVDQHLMDDQHQREAITEQQLMQEDISYQTMVDASHQKRQKDSKNMHRQQQQIDQHLMYDQHQREATMENQLMQTPQQTEVDASLKKRRKGSRKKHRQQQEEVLIGDDQHLMYDQSQQERIMDQQQHLVQEQPLQTEADDSARKEQERRERRRQQREGETDEERKERRRRRKERKERQRQEEEAALLASQLAKDITEEPQDPWSPEKLVVIKRPEKITFETNPYPCVPNATSYRKPDASNKTHRFEDASCASQLNNADEATTVDNTPHAGQNTTPDQTADTIDDKPEVTAKTPFIKALLGPPTGAGKSKPLSFKWRKLITSKGERKPMKATAPAAQKEEKTEAVHFQFDDITSVLAPTETEQEMENGTNPRPADLIDEVAGEVSGYMTHPAATEGSRSHKYLAKEDYKPNSNIARMISKYMRNRRSPTADTQAGQVPHLPVAMQPRPPTAKPRPQTARPQPPKPRPQINREKVSPPRKHVFHKIPEHEEWRPQIRRSQFPEIKETGVLRSQPVCPQPPSADRAGRHAPHPPTGKHGSSSSYRARLARQAQMKVMPGGRVPNTKQQRRQ